MTRYRVRWRQVTGKARHVEAPTPEAALARVQREVEADLEHSHWQALGWTVDELAEPKEAT